MNAARLFALLAALACAPAQAGHGLMNSFGDIEWLGTPTVTPDAWYYRAITLKEELAYYTAGSPDAKAARCLATMREKLAEALAMVKQGAPPATAVALSRHGDFLGRALALARGDEGAVAADFPLRLATALLEQRYMLSVEYPDLPAPTRSMLDRWMSASEAAYEALRARLPRATRESLFFKEEEVRWSWEMARRGAELPPATAPALPAPTP